MESPVQVLAQADFDSWVRAQTGESDDPAVRGQRLATQFGCLACHSIDGSRLVGPTWQGVYGSSETLTDGSTVTVDDAYIIESIHDPEVKIVQGFPNVMPANIGDQLSDEQIQDIIAFIQSLR
jgi:cytochrome c oxidase subunit 2